MQAAIGCYRPFVCFCSLSSEYFYIAPRVEIPHGYIVVFGAAIDSASPDARKCFIQN